MSMDSRPPSVTIISLLDSTQNHKESLADLARQVDRALSGYEYELILVTEDIPNRTETTFEPLADKYPIKLVRSTGKVGPTVLAELKEARGQVIGIIENEPQRSIERIPQLLDALEKGADIAIASRYVPGGAIKGRNTGQKLLSSITTSLARLVLPSVRRARDPLSGLFMLRKAVAEDLGQTTLGPRILLGTLASGSNWQVREIPYVEEKREARDKHRLRDVLSSLGQILALATRERELRRFVQFGLVGLSGVGVNMGTFWFFTRIVELRDLVALAFAYIAATLSNFALNDIWTFRDRRVGKAKATLIRGLKFGLVSGGAIAIYYAVYTPLTRYLDLYDMAALAIAIGFGLVWNFSVNVLWTWKRGARQASSDH